MKLPLIFTLASFATSAFAATDIFGSDHSPGCQSCVDSLNLACNYRTAFDAEYLSCLCDPASDTASEFKSCIQSSGCADENVDDAMGIIDVGTQACGSVEDESGSEEGVGGEDGSEGSGSESEGTGEEGEVEDSEVGDGGAEPTTVADAGTTTDAVPSSSSTPGDDSGALANAVPVLGLVLAGAMALGM